MVSTGGGGKEVAMIDAAVRLKVFGTSQLK